MRRNISLEEGHIFTGGTRSGEAGGGFDIVGPALGYDTAKHDLLFLGEKTGLNNDLQHQIAAGGFDLSDLIQKLVPLPILSPSDIDDHIDLTGTVGNGITGLKNLDCSG